MKKIKNMNYQEAKKSFEDFNKNTVIAENYDMNFKVLTDIESLLITNRNALFDAIYDVYCIGFMAGYKQNSMEFEEKHNEHFQSNQKNIKEPFFVSKEKEYKNSINKYMDSIHNLRYLRFIEVFLKNLAE